MRSFLLSVLFCTFVICQQTHATDSFESITQSCLDKNGLTVGDFGFSTLSDLVTADDPFLHMTTVDEDKRSCALACILQKMGAITKDGTITTKLQSPDNPNEFLNLFEKIGPVCGAEKDFCKLGACIYSTYEQRPK